MRISQLLGNVPTIQIRFFPLESIQSTIEYYVHVKITKICIFLLLHVQDVYFYIRSMLWKLDKVPWTYSSHLEYEKIHNCFMVNNNNVFCVNLTFFLLAHILPKINSLMYVFFLYIHFLRANLTLVWRKQ